MPHYMYFILATVALVVGYLIYGTIVSKIFGAEPARPTPAKTMKDGVDYVEMPLWKVWLVQLLNIAGVGPVFGPILGAVWGPAALWWIVIGTIFAGAVHDFMAGMLSVRYGGANVPAVVGYNLGNIAKQIMRVFAVVLLLLVGVVFVAAPARMLANITPDSMNLVFWICVIFGYYFLATIVPIDKIIGNFYPIFGAVLIFMALGVTVMMFVDMPGQFYHAVSSWDVNLDPKARPIFPLVFITIACGALSGFHATQSPLMARCMANEKMGKSVFYGSMVAEGFIGLVWATAGMTFYPFISPATGDFVTLSAATASPATVVTQTCMGLMGEFGGIIAILGVVVLPITSGDTAFRAARLTISEAMNFSQKVAAKRLYIAIPLFLMGIFLAMINFDIIWRYFGWANQSLATIMLFAGAAWLMRRHKFHWICTVPAVFMTAVCISYICYEPTMGFKISIEISNWIGIAAALVALVWLLIMGRKPLPQDYEPLDSGHHDGNVKANA